jgi:integrase
MAKPATGTDTITTDGTVVTRVSLRNGVRISVPLFRGPEDPHLPWLRSQIIGYARALYTRALAPLTRQEIADELCNVAQALRSVEDGRALRGAWERVIAQDLVTRNRDAKLQAAIGGTLPTVKDVMELWLTGEISRRHPAITLQKKAKEIRRTCERYILPEVGHFPVNEIRVHHFEQVFNSPLQKHLGHNSKILTWKYLTQIMSLAETPLGLIDRRPNSAALKPDEIERVNANLQPLDIQIVMGCQAVSVHDRIFWGYLAHEGVRISEALDLRWLDIIILGASTPVVSHLLIKVSKRATFVLSPGMYTALMRYRELFRPGESDDTHVFRPTCSPTDEAETFRAHLKRAGITRAELFDHDPKRLQYRVRAHDLRGLFVTRALAAGMPDSYIRDRTGHTSVAMIERYRGRAELLKATGQTEFEPLDSAIPELRAKPVAALPISHVLPAQQPPAAHLRLVSNS